MEKLTNSLNSLELSENTSLIDYPPDIITKIMMWLDGFSVAALTSTCRGLYSLEIGINVRWLIQRKYSINDISRVFHYRSIIEAYDHRRRLLGVDILRSTSSFANKLCGKELGPFDAKYNVHNGRLLASMVNEYADLPDEKSKLPAWQTLCVYPPNDAKPFDYRIQRFISFSDFTIGLTTDHRLVLTGCYDQRSSLLRSHLPTLNQLPILQIYGGSRWCPITKINQEEIFVLNIEGQLTHINWVYERKFPVQNQLSIFPLLLPPIIHVETIFSDTTWIHAFAADGRIYQWTQSGLTELYHPDIVSCLDPTHNLFLRENGEAIIYDALSKEFHPIVESDDDEMDDDESWTDEDEMSIEESPSDSDDSANFISDEEDSVWRGDNI